MSAQIIIHPAVGLHAMTELCARTGLQIDSIVGKTGAVRCTVNDVAPETARFRCRGCGWSGESPAWCDMRRYYPEALGQVPYCPRCTSSSILFI